MLTHLAQAGEFVPPVINWSALTPLIIIFGAGVLGILLEAFLPDGKRRGPQIALALVAQVGAFVALIWVGQTISESPDPLAALPVGSALILDSWTLVVQGVILLCSILATLVMVDRTSAKQDHFAPSAAAIPNSPYEELTRKRGLEQTEVYPLFLFALGGMLVFPASGDLVTMFIALEVLSLPLYVLTAMARRRRLLSQEASFKYMILGAFASALFLFGAALLYGFSGSVTLSGISSAVMGHAQSPTGLESGVLLLFGIIMVLAGILFKIGAVPFQSWTPDVYQGAPTPITGFMAACTKIAAVGLLVRVVIIVVVSSQVDVAEAATKGLWVVAIATMLLGAVVGATQTDMKRMLGYSSIAHAGFVLVAFLGFNAGTLDAVMIYLLVYGVTTIGAFGIVTLVREVGPGGEILGEATHIGQWAGLGKRNPLIAGLFALFLLSFAGIPMTAGFIAKYHAFSSALAGEATLLVIMGIISSAISLFFYIRVIVLMFFVAPAEERIETGEQTQAGPNLADPAEDPSPFAANTEPVELDELTAAARTAVIVPQRSRAVQVVDSEGPTLAVIFFTGLFVVILGVFPAPILSLISSLLG